MRAVIDTGDPGLEEWKRLFGQLWRIRAFEGQVQTLAAAGEVPGFAHLSTGQEAVAVGVCAHLGREDALFTSHRGHGHVLAKGSDARAMLAEIIGRSTGLCQGHGGSMHLVDAPNGVLGATGVVGGNLPLAAGAAWAAQARGKAAISVVFFGDGATGAGIFHETVNLSVLWQLPVLFVCENNGYAEFTSREEHSTVGSVRAFADPYGMAAATVDGNDLPAVFEAAREATARVRSGAGPYLLECMTHRMAGHYVGDAQHYRSREELAAVTAKCPIERMKRRLLGLAVAREELDAIGEAAIREMAQAVADARAGAPADPRMALCHVYGAPALQANPGAGE